MGLLSNLKPAGLRPLHRYSRQLSFAVGIWMAVEGGCSINAALQCHLLKALRGTNSATDNCILLFKADSICARRTGHLNYHYVKCDYAYHNFSKSFPVPNNCT